MDADLRIRDRLRRGLLTADEERFWSKVNIVIGRGCWEYCGSRRNVDGQNYGNFRWKAPGADKSTSVNASRFAYFSAYGKLPTVGRHRCDNPPCCRPSHLLDGTHADNGRDKAERGRGRGKDQRGELNASATLTEDMVRQARTLYMDGLTYAAIAERIDAPPAAIGFAVRGQTWAHITDPPPVAERRKKKLTEAQIEEIREARAAGESCLSIASRYGVTMSNVSYLTRPKRDPSLPKRVKRELTDAEVREIRAARAMGERVRTIAERYAISSGYVSHIATRRAYGHVPD